ncbi:MAG TPA: hypothetical protein VMN60_00690 [Longimicrobiales bacterium]|nr:hypothetical protein [Longimicrobiales bacterium]
MSEYLEDSGLSAVPSLALGTAVERTVVAGADRAAATRAVRRAVAQLDVDAALSLNLLHRAGAPPIAVAGSPDHVLEYALSVAHRDGHAVAVASRSDRHIGVDVERADTIGAAEVRMFASVAERAAGIDPTVLWLLKEAAWKALACPPNLPFHALQLELKDGALLAVNVSDRRLRARAHVWSPWLHWLASLVVIPPQTGAA